MTSRSGASTRFGPAIVLGALLTAILGSGCTTNHGDYTVLSNKLVRSSNFELSKADRKKSVVGEDVAHIILFFPTKQQVTMEEAVDDALEKGDGDVMTDATVKFTSWYIPLIYGTTKWVVEGDVVKTRRN